MAIVDQWTGHEACILRHALRLSVRDFAAILGVNDRTVSRWEAAGATLTPRPEMQRALDTQLDRSTPADQARFFTRLTEEVSRPSPPRPSTRWENASLDDVTRRSVRAPAPHSDTAASTELPVSFWDHPAMRHALSSHHMGKIIKAYRLHDHHARRISQEHLADRAATTQSQISRIENGPPMTDLDRLGTWARLLNIPAEYLWFPLEESVQTACRETENPDRYLASSVPTPCPPTEISPGQSPTGIDTLWVWGDDEQMRRRNLLGLLASTAALTAIAGDTAEGARRGLEHLLPVQVTDRDLDEWERSVTAYGVERCSAPPQVMLQHLLTDITEVNDLMTRQLPTGTRERLLRVATQLAALTAVTVIATGAPQAGRRWWRTANRMADHLTDPGLRTFILARHAISGLYCGYSHEHVLGLADEALNGPGRDLVCVGTASAAAARAQSLAVLGRDAEARRSLEQLRGLVDRLSGSITAPSTSWFAYPEYRVFHAECYTYTYLGRTRDAARAQDAAVRSYPQDNWAGLSQIELHRATCMIKDGYVEDGIEHATNVLNELPTSLRNDRWILNVAHATSSSVPASARKAPAAQDLREMLALTSRSA
jgi:transcriptional regulator with XRE-family HTH domain